MKKDRDAIRSILSRDDEETQLERIEAYVDKARVDALIWAARKYKINIINGTLMMKVYAMEHEHDEGPVHERFYDDDGNEWDKERTLEYLNAIDGYNEDLNSMTAIEFVNYTRNAAKGPKYDGDEMYDEEDVARYDEMRKGARVQTVIISPDGEFVNCEGYAKGAPKPFPVPSGGIVVADTSEDCRKIQDMMSSVRDGDVVDAGTEEKAKIIFQMITRDLYSTTENGKTTDCDFVMDGTMVKRVERKENQETS
jgi:hypothetical protein